MLDSAIESLSTLAREIEGEKVDGMTYRDAAARLLEELSDGTDAKIYTGIDHLDRVTDGFRAGELALRFARPAVTETRHAQSDGFLTFSRPLMIRALIKSLAPNCGSYALGVRRPLR